MSKTFSDFSGSIENLLLRVQLFRNIESPHNSSYAILCRFCGDVIESETVHDFKFCSCKTVAVDGGHKYLRRCFKNSPEDFEDLSVTEEVEEE